MNLTSAVKNWIRSPEEELSVVDLDAVHGAPKRALVSFGTRYISLTMKTMHLLSSKEFGTNIYANVHAIIEYTHSMDGKIEKRVNLSPKDLTSNDNYNHRFVQQDQRIIWSIPLYNPIRVDIGLFAVRGDNVSLNYLSLLGKLADISSLGASKILDPYKDILKEGANLFFGSPGSSELQVGVGKDYQQVSSGWTLVMKRPRKELDVSKLRVSQSLVSVCDEEGRELVEWPYFIFEISAHEKNHEWSRIPELHDAWKDLHRVAVEGPPKDIEPALHRYQRLCKLSPDLLPEDGVRLANLASERVKAAWGSGLTAGDDDDKLGSHESLGLYG